MSTRNGKIARLSFEVREELNHRLLENQPAKNIVSWLNSNMTVRLFMDRLFEGRPITEQNISEWRQGGYEEWLTQRECLSYVSGLSEDAARTAFTGINTEHLLLVLTGAFAEMIKKQAATPEDAFDRKLAVLQNLTKTALAMRRSEQRDARLKLDRERVEILRQKNPDSSPTFCTSQDPYFDIMRNTLRYPCDPRAPEFDRPSTPPQIIPRAPASTKDDWMWPSSAPSPVPYPSGASTNREPAGSAGVAAPPVGPTPTQTGSPESESAYTKSV